MEFLKHLEIVLLVLAVISFAVYLVLDARRTRRKNETPVETSRALVYFKHPESEAMTVRTSVGLWNEHIHYITFHTDSGDILKLYLHEKDFLAIPEGTWGTLTWQGDKFWKFETEV